MTVAQMPTKTTKHCFWLNEKTQPHQKIEIVITSVCDFHGVKWQDVFRERKKSRGEYMNVKHIIAHLLEVHTGHEIACEVTGYLRPFLYKCADYYWANRKKYLELSNVISRKINNNYLTN